MCDHCTGKSEKSFFAGDFKNIRLFIWFCWVKSLSDTLYFNNITINCAATA